ncbi:MAG: hypothetical protein CFE23_06180 [Flavobacterium sp. BFFFF1]|uniref:hypothetical protein n=1 Tax=unclassified Flavobacterium TaxID=196869 RepID=UPI000BDC4164|nr:MULTISPECIES: hypothetical protein [unclassified Flavobacterium]OYU81079.1 MAG: hypothetical protein CFE23_06180 [Flavobacterium sp. BFFFF1]
MKKLVFSLALIASIFTGCSSDDESAPEPVVGEITGTITANTVYAYGNYTLKGIVKINPGVTVTFDAGSTITANKTTGDNALVVLNGGKLIINGTASQPVVFTEASQVPGSWGGIIMYGDAPIKAVGGAVTATSEDGNNQTYGGTNTTHNGGSLNYVRVEYAGAKLADGTKENNAFTFYSVGSGTQLDHLVAYKGADDGYEFFGGTVSATNLVSYGNFDDAFDWQDGWQGQNNSNWYAYQTVKGNFGMEIEASNNNNTFFPKVTNVTLKRATGTTPEVAGTIEIDAFQFKKQGNGDFSNVVIEGYGEYTEGANTYHGAAVKIQDAQTNTDQVLASRIKVTNAKISGTTQTTPVGATVDLIVAFPTGTFTTSNTATGASLTTGNWATVGTTNLLQ